MTTGTATQVRARNQISGTITNIQSGTAMSVVTVSAKGHIVVSAITNQAVEELGLKKNDSVIALVKANEAIIAKCDADEMKVSARDKVSGRVTDFVKALRWLL
jgi:molybdopterin-binding protein